MPLARSASVKARAVRPARSRSTREQRDVLTLEQPDAAEAVRECHRGVRAFVGEDDRRCSSQAGSSGEKTTPRHGGDAGCRNRRAAARMPAVSNGTIGRPSYSWPPRA